MSDVAASAAAAAPPAETPAADEPTFEEEDEEKELEMMKQRVKEMEAEAAKLREMQAEAEREASAGPSGSAAGSGMEGVLGAEEEKEAIDARSIYVGNVDYAATPEEVQQHFAACGTINRVTILCDKFTGHPKGYAYVEFADPSLVQNAMVLNESLFRGRLIKVVPKRTNIPGMKASRGRGRGRGGYRGGRGGYYPRGRGGYRGRGAPY